MFKLWLNDSDKQENNKLQEKIKNLDQWSQEVIHYRNLYWGKFKTVEAECDRLQSDNDRLKSEHDRLQSENDRLKSDNEKIRQFVREQFRELTSLFATTALSANV